MRTRILTMGHLAMAAAIGVASRREPEIVDEFYDAESGTVTITISDSTFREPVRPPVMRAPVHVKPPRGSTNADLDRIAAAAAKRERRAAKLEKTNVPRG